MSSLPTQILSPGELSTPLFSELSELPPTPLPMPTPFDDDDDFEEQWLHFESQMADVHQNQQALHPLPPKNLPGSPPSLTGFSFPSCSSPWSSVSQAVEGAAASSTSGTSRRAATHTVPARPGSPGLENVSTMATIKELLSKRDQKTEEFLKKVLDDLQPGNEQFSADELRDRWFREANTKLNQVSVTLSHKMTALLQHALQQKIDDCLNDTYAVIETTAVPQGQMAKRYRTSFDVWIGSDDCVSIVAGNPLLLKNIHPSHYFVLALFAYATNRRVRGDDLLMLCITGESSVGKSTLFENCLIEGSHLQCNEEGVGRFKTGSKNILFYHDVPITRLWIGRDAEKVRTISRGETTVAKVHSTTQMIAPLFVLVTSNMRLMDHRFHHPVIPSGFQLYPCQAVPTGNRRPHNLEMLKAIQMRFLEVYCRRAPPLDTNLLPKNGCFQRSHLIVGLFTKVLGIIGAYSKEDFYSDILASYVINGLCKNFDISARLLELDDSVRTTLQAQVTKFADPRQVEALLQMLA